MKTLYRVIVLGVADFVLIWSWVYYLNPSPSSSLGVFLWVPAIFALNAGIAAFLFINKRKTLASAFLINSFVASVLMYFLFNAGIARHQNNRLESWTFRKSDTTFTLVRWKETNEFGITYSLRPGSSSGLLNGTCTKDGRDWVLKSGSTEMRIENNTLKGFRSPSNRIEMEKVER